MAVNPSEQEKEKIMEEFVGLLPMLRARLGLTQEQFGQKIGATRQTIITVENKKRKLTWSMFLSMVFVFFIDPKTRPFLMASDIINEDLSKILFGDSSMLTEATSMLDPNRPMLSKASEMINRLKKDDNE